MKPLIASTLVSALLGTAAFAATQPPGGWTTGFTEGKAPFKSIGQLAFGPDGILFAADSRAAAIIALDTRDKTAAAAKPIKVEDIGKKVAALLGTAPDQILIEDLAVNPVSHKAYLSVSRGRGPDALPALVRVDTDGRLELVDLEKSRFSRMELPNPPADNPGGGGGGGRGGNSRMESITDIAFFEDRVLVAGLSNEEFASTLRDIPFPFKTIDKGTSVEIYHGAHGQFETRAPIRTFVPMNVGNQPTLLAAYTCTPLVQVPLKDLQPGAKIKGKTVAELGNRNRPLDIILYQKGGKDFLLLANSARGVMKVPADPIEATTAIVEPVRGGGSSGVPFESVQGWTGINQLDRLDAQTAIVLRRTSSGEDHLESMPLP